MVDEEEILEVFLLDSVKYCSSRRQVKWLELRLQDSSGSISARVWGEHVRMEYQNMAGRLVLVRGKVHFYAGRPELAVEQIQEISEEKKREFERTKKAFKELMAYDYDVALGGVKHE